MWLTAEITCRDTARKTGKEASAVPTVEPHPILQHFLLTQKQTHTHTRTQMVVSEVFSAAAFLLT